MNRPILWKRRRAGLVLSMGAASTNVTISGQGIIDGAGARWWPPVREAKRAGLPDPVRRPRLVVLTDCRNVRVQDVTLRNSPMFHLVAANCENVLISNVTILMPRPIPPNTDAMGPPPPSACAPCPHHRLPH